MLIRPITYADFPSLKALALSAGIGFTSLPPEDSVLSRRIERAVETFQGKADRSVADYLFVLEMESGEIGGCCGIAGAVGLETPWYHYRMGLSVRHSKRLNTISRMELMFLSNDLTGSSELCSLLLAPTTRGSGIGTLISKSRYLFIADHRDLFDDQLIAEMRGVINENGIPPFWEAVGRHFFKTDFHTVNLLASSGDKAYIAEMMLTHPLYVDMLPDYAREVIGKVQDDTIPAVHLLESEGFRKSGYIDIFDAGPVMLASTSEIRAVKESELYATKPLKIRDPNLGLTLKDRWIVSNCKHESFRAIWIEGGPVDGVLALTAEEMKRLKVETGELVRAVSLYPKSRSYESINHG